MREHECCWHGCLDHRGGEVCCHCGDERGRHGPHTPQFKFWYGTGPAFNCPSIWCNNVALPTALLADGSSCY